MSERINPLANLDDFTIKSTEKKPKLRPEAIEQLSQEAGFPSRQPPRPTVTEPPKRQQRRYTTGRNVQIPIKGTAETRALLEALADQLNEPFGQVLALALVALQRELEAGKGT